MSDQEKVNIDTISTENLENKKPSAIVSALEDPEILQDKLENSLDFVNKNRNLFTYVVLGIALLVGGYFGYQWYQTDQNNEAQKEMFQAVLYFEADSLNKALNGDAGKPGLKRIAEDYAGTKAGNLANFYVGVIYLKQGKFDEAITHLSSFSSTDLLVQARAYSLLGDAYAEKNNLDEAVNYYRKAAEYKPNKNFTPIYLKKLAGALVDKKDTKGALEAYDKIISEYPLSQEYNDALKMKAFYEGAK